MYAKQFPIEPYEDDTATGSATPVCNTDASPFTHLIDALTDSATAFVARYPTSAPANAATQLASVVEGIVPEPCGIRSLSLDERTVACILAPSSGHAFTPLDVHALLDLLIHRIQSAPDFAPQPVIIPIAQVSPASVIKENLDALSELLETLLHHKLGAQFQPIVNLMLGRVYGYEALIRVPQTGALKRLGALYRTAEEARIVSWLNMACQDQCLKTAAQAGVREHLFINMDAAGLSYMYESEKSLARRIAEAHLAPSRVVIEITERQAVEDFPRLVVYIDRLRQEGFKIAIDDAGEGYSSLHAIAELRPDFVKVGRPLVRNVDTNGARRALLDTLNRYSVQIGASVVAEGIETRDELATVIELGVGFGQGYLLSRPKDSFHGLRREMREFVLAQADRHRQRIGGRAYSISAMAREGLVVPSDTPIDTIAHKFERNADVKSFVVVNDDAIVGLIMRDHLMEALRQTPDLRERTVDAVMERQPMVVESQCPIEEVAYQASSGTTRRFQDDILVTDNGKYVGVVPVRALLEAVVTLQRNRSRHAHPLTGLPGRIPLEEETERLLRGGVPGVIVRARILNLRSINEVFGIGRGDEMLIATAGLLERTVQQHASSGYLVAHCGGAGFFLLLHPNDAEAVCRAACAEYDSTLACAASEATGDDTQGSVMCRLRMAGVATTGRNFTTFEDIERVLTVILRPPTDESSSSFTIT